MMAKIKVKKRENSSAARCWNSGFFLSLLVSKWCLGKKGREGLYTRNKMMLKWICQENSKVGHWKWWAATSIWVPCTHITWPKKKNIIWSRSRTWGCKGWFLKPYIYVHTHTHTHTYNIYIIHDICIFLAFGLQRFSANSITTSFNSQRKLKE